MLGSQIVVMIIDDEPQNLLDAYRYVKSQGHLVLLSSTYQHAIDLMAVADVVITDLFMPWPKNRIVEDDIIEWDNLNDKERLNESELAIFGENVDLAEEYRIAKTCLINFPADQPVGLGVAALAKNLGKPCVICTSSHHHAMKLEWICYTPILEILDSQPIEGIKPQENRNYELEFPKNWELALEEALRMLKEKKQ